MRIAETPGFAIALLGGKLALGADDGYRQREQLGQVEGQRASGDAWAVALHDIVRCNGREDRRLALALVERQQQITAQILLRAQRSQRLCGAQRHLSGVRAEEQRRRRNDPAIDKGVVQRDVMAAEAPSPVPRVWRAEDRE